MAGLICAAACLPAGFGVAVATGVRPLGGIALVVLTAAAGLLSGAPGRRQAQWYLVVIGCFIASHLLGHLIGAWAAVTTVTVVATASYVRILQRAAAAVAR